MANPCAACKHLRQACVPNCDLAPYFPADKPHRFSVVHSVFGKNKVLKLLREVDVTQREQAVDSLVYEAEARLRDPVYGCMGFVTVLQQRLNQVQERLRNAENELAKAKHYNHDTVESVINKPHCFGFKPDNNIGESQQQPIVTAAEKHQMFLGSERGFSIGDGGLGHHHMSVHDEPVGPSSDAFDFEMGGTSLSGYRQPPNQ